MNEVLINAFVARINVGQMTLEQVPIPYQEHVLNKISPPEEDEERNQD